MIPKPLSSSALSGGAALVLAVSLLLGAVPSAQAQTPASGDAVAPAKPPKPAKQPKAQKPPAAPADAAAPAPAPAGSGKGAAGLVGGGSGQGPLEVTADNGIEMQQANKVYVARGNAVAKRGNVTIYADTLSAYYRDVPNSSQTEVWRVVAEGNVKATTPTQTVVGDHGVYDIDQTLIVMTGEHLQLTTPTDVVTAKDSLEWYDNKQLGVARGNAVATRADRKVRGDVLAAQVVTPQGEASRISRVDAKGHVIVSRPDSVGTGDSGVYNAETGIATLLDHVTLTRGENTVVGQYGVIDLNTGVSRMLPRPPAGAQAAGDHTTGRVQGIIMPHKSDPKAGDQKAGDQKNSDQKAGASKPAPAAQKAQPDQPKAQ